MSHGSFVSRGGLKLQHALSEFHINVSGFACVDLGCSTGGFTDCLLQSQASCVYAVDTGYGVLDWKLRNDPRVKLFERSNALHLQVPSEVIQMGGLDLAVIDLGWTRQEHALPAAHRWLRKGGQIITLIKPHYEQERARGSRDLILDDDQAEHVLTQTLARMAHVGYEAQGVIESPIRGGKKRNKGNREWLARIVVKHSVIDA